MSTTIIDALDGVANADPSDLLTEWQAILFEENRRGILGGIGGDGKPLAPVRYRLGLVSAKPSVRMRKRISFTRRARRTHEYLEASGPPLAPFGEKSRTISNFVTRSYHQGVEYGVECGWADVLSRPTKKRPAEPFLRYHFYSVAVARKQPYPKRDLRGVRPTTRPILQKAVQKWLAAAVKTP